MDSHSTTQHVLQAFPVRRSTKEGEAEEDMAKYFQRRPGRDGCQLAYKASRIASDREDGDFSSPDAPRGTGGKSVSKIHQIIHNCYIPQTTGDDL